VTSRLGALAAVVSAEVGRRSRRAFLVALGAGLLANFALGSSVLPIEISANLLISYAVFLVVFAGVLAALLYQQFGGAFGDALAVAGWARLESEERWKRLGAGRIPRSPAEASRWLQLHGDPSTLEGQRFSCLLFVGDLGRAREVLATYPLETPYQRFDAASDRWFLDFLEGQLPPFDEPDRLAAAVTDDHESKLAAAGMATLRAHAAVAQGGDWVAPLAETRQRIGDAAAGVIGARYVLPAWTASVAIAAVLIGVALLVGRLGGIWR
jgi:hypothetical protein